MLTAKRLTSHSQGPGRVSSKSLISNTSWRSGEAKTPKFERCASPQHCTASSVRGVLREVTGHDQCRPAIEGKRGNQHSPVADGHQLGHAGCSLALEQLDRVGAISRWLIDPVTGARHQLARRPASGHPLRLAQVLHFRGRFFLARGCHPNATIAAQPNHRTQIGACTLGLPALSSRDRRRTAAKCHRVRWDR